MGRGSCWFDPISQLHEWLVYKKHAVPTLAALAAYGPGIFWCVCFWNLLFLLPQLCGARIGRCTVVGAAMQGHGSVFFLI